MNKKFYLGAILLGAMTLSTGALTSCIDNDEPEGITNLRGAKAELLRAKAAVELAKAETEKQNANWVAALAAIDQAKAKQEEAKAKQEEAKVAYEQAKAAYEQALAEQQKAEALKQMAYAQQAQADAEAQIAAIKAENEVYLLMQKKLLLEAQNDYDKLVAEIEAAKAVLTDEQATKLAALQTAVDKAWKKYTAQQDVVLDKMQALFDATNTEVDVEEALRDALADAESDLAAKTAVYDELKALSENVAPTAWEARMDSLKAYSDRTNGTHKLEIAELNLKLTEIKQSEAYKTADAEDKAALDAYIAAQQEYNYLANGSKMDCFNEADERKPQFGYKESNTTHPTLNTEDRSAKKYDLQGAKIVITNPEVYSKLVGTTGLEQDAPGKNMRLEVAEIKEGLKYSEFTNLFSTDPSATQPTITKIVTEWELALGKISVTDEEIAADNCVANYEKALADAQKDHNEAVAKWEKAHKTYSNQAVETSVSTDVFKAAIKTYNDNIDALEAAVTAYNNARDAALTANTATIYNALKEVYDVETYKNYLTTNCPDAEVKAYFGDPTKVTANQWKAAKTVAGVDQIVASCEADITGFTDPDYKTVAKLQAAAKKAVNRSFVIDDAEDAINEVAESKAKSGVAKGGTLPVPSLSITATFANGIPSVDDTKAVKDAKAVIFNADTKNLGLDDKLKGLGYVLNDDNTTTKAYTGAFKTIDRAIKDFQALAKENSEKLTNDNVTDPAKVDKYLGIITGTETKFHKAGDAKDSDPSVTFSDGSFIKPLVYLDEETEKYAVDYDKYMVVRTKVSDENIDAMCKVEFDAVVAEANWNTASNAAFGTPYRHTELTVDLINKNTSPYEDEAGNQLNNWAASTLKALDEAKQKLANHQNFQGVNAEIASLKAKVAEAKAAMLAQIAEYTTAVNEAEAAIEPAKKAHQAKHNAAEALLKPVMAEIAKIYATVGEYNALAANLQAILDAYYAINDFSYVDENGVTQNITWGANKDFSQVAAWLKGEIKNYETAIETAEDAVAAAQKNLDRWIADGEFDAVAEAQLALDNAQALLETLKARYDFALSQLNDYVAALSK